jgi:uncharacterized membrane protein
MRLSSHESSGRAVPIDRRRRNVTLWIVMTLVLAAIVHVGVIRFYPSAIMLAFKTRYTSNRVFHVPKVTAGKLRIVRPSPDLLYSLAVFDLEGGPLRITAPVPGSYVSLSIYGSNSDNFHVTNDRCLVGPEFDVALIGPHDPEPDVGRALVVRAPSATGVIVFRYFIGDDSQTEKIRSARQRIALRPVG